MGVNVTENKDKERIQQEYDEMMKQFERDSHFNDYSDPEMDKWFNDTLDQEFKKSRRRKILNVAGIAAAIILAVGLALNGFTQVTYGESLIDIVKYSIEAGQFTITRIGKNDDCQFEEYEAPVIEYKANSIEDAFAQLMENDDLEVNELFYVTDVPVRYGTWIVKYNKESQKLVIQSHITDNYLYIFEELDYQNAVSGTILESEIVSTVFNENLQLDINIIQQMDNIRNIGYYFEVFYRNKYLTVEGHGTLEEFETLAKSISFIKE